MFLGYRVVLLAGLLIVPPVAAQTSHGSASDTAHAGLVETMKQDLRRLVKAEDAFLARKAPTPACFPKRRSRPGRSAE